MDHLVLALLVDKGAFFSTAESKDINSRSGEAEKVLLHIKKESTHLRLPELETLMLDYDSILILFGWKILNDHIKCIDENRFVGYH